MRQIRYYTAALLASALTSSLSFAQQPQPRPSAGAAPAGAPQVSRDARPPRGGRGAGGQNGPGRGPDVAGPDGRGGPRRDMMGRGPAGMLLAAKDRLELTPDQVKKLEALQAAPRVQPNEAEMLRVRADMIEATKGDGDLTKARAALDKMSRLRNDEAITRLKARQDVRSVLTAAQKAKLDNMRGMMRGRMRQGMRKGMRQGMSQRMRMQGGPGMGQGFGPGGRPGMGGGNGPGMMGPNGPDRMQPAMGRRGRVIEQDVVIERRAPVPPSDSLNNR